MLPYGKRRLLIATMMESVFEISTVHPILMGRTEQFPTDIVAGIPKVQADSRQSKTVSPKSESQTGNSILAGHYLYRTNKTENHETAVSVILHRAPPAPMFPVTSPTSKDRLKFQTTNLYCQPRTCRKNRKVTLIQVRRPKTDVF